MAHITALKRAIESQGIKQTWLAKAAGISPSELSRIVRGRVNSTPD